MSDSGRYSRVETDPLDDLKDLGVGTKVWLTEVMPSEEIEDDSEADTPSVDDKDVEEPEDKESREINPEDGEVASSLFSKGGVTAMQHVTRAPSRFSQASFIKELEAIGVGRPSTYAKIFQILKERGYVHVDGQTLIPTLKGMIVSAWLEKHFPDLIEPSFTGNAIAISNASYVSLFLSLFLSRSLCLSVSLSISLSLSLSLSMYTYIYIYIPNTPSLFLTPSPLSPA
jgi:DNA topoisomerase-1